MEKVSDDRCLTSIDELDEHWGRDVATGTLIRDCRAIFNKITDKTLPSFMMQFEELIYKESKGQVKKVAAMYFGKIAREPLFLNAYVEFTVNLSRRQQLFKEAIIRECQKQFERNVLDYHLNEQLQLLRQKIDGTENVIDRDKLQFIYDEEKQKLFQESLVIVRFIGELYNNGMLTARIMIFCINVLVGRDTEESLECLCNLLITIGSRLQNEIIDMDQSSTLNHCFEALDDAAENKNPYVKVCGRLRCLIQNVVDMQENNWLCQREAVSVSPVECRRNTDPSTSNQNRSNGSGKSSPKKAAESGESVNTELILKQMKDLLNNEIDVETIQEYIATNFTDFDADSIRAILRTVVESLMEEDTLKLRGNEEAASILQMFFELLEKQFTEK